MAASQTNTRIYRVTNGKTEHLVRATHPTHAIRHVVLHLYPHDAEVAKADDLVRLTAAGVKVEEAT